MDEEDLLEITLIIDHKGGVEYTTKYSDMVLVVDGNEIPVHRQVLALRSEYFAIMFYGEFEESTKNRIHIKDMKWSPFKKIIEFLYTGKLTALPTEVPEVYVVARMLCLSEAMQEICTFMSGEACIFHFKQYTNFAYQFDVPELQKEMHTVWQEVLYWDLKETSDFCEEAILGFLSFEVRPNNELFKFQLATNWLEANGETKAQVLMSKINLANFTMEDIKNHVRPSGYFTDEQIIDAVF